MDLPDFLLARIVEDEAAATAAAEFNPPPWSVHVWRDELTGLVIGGETPENCYLGGALWDNEGAESLSMEPATAVHVARHDPARVLAECTAKRAIVELHPFIGWADPVGPRRTCRTCGDTVTVDWPCPTLRLLAQPYAGHPDFRPAWRV